MLLFKFCRSELKYAQLKVQSISFIYENVCIFYYPLLTLFDWSRNFEGHPVPVIIFDAAIKPSRSVVLPKGNSRAIKQTLLTF